MTFLELCVRVRQESGISGDGPLSVISQQGILAKVVEWVRQADIDIQTLHSNWSFLWRMSDATLTTDVRLYEAADIGLSTMQSIKKFTIDGNDLTEMDWDCFTAQKYHTAPDKKQPTCFTVRPDGKVMVFPVPDADYTVSAEYFATPQQMLANNDVSPIPARYHDAILHYALMYYASHEEDNSLYQVASKRFEDQLSLLAVECLPKISLNRGALF